MFRTRLGKNRVFKLFKRFSHFFCGLLTGVLVDWLPVASWLLFIFFIVYECIEFVIKGDRVVRDLREFGIGLVLGILLSLLF